MRQLGLGIVGTGMIAGVIAEAITQSSHGRLVAVSSRRLDNAKKFIARFPDAAAVEGIEALLAQPGVEAIYVATPTVAKEKIALSAIAAGKHVLVDKPFIDEASVLRMSQAAAARGLVFLDATHFVHHPRAAAIRAATAERIGSPRSLHTAFYFPFSDRNNIRFDPKQEPTGVLGDMAWYSMRAIVEYFTGGSRHRAMTFPEIDRQTGSMVRCSGLIGFASGEVSTYDVGYTAGTVLQDLQLLGTTGVIQMDDFVLDWTTSWAFHDPAVPCGYIHRTGAANRGAFTFVPTPSPIGAQILLVEGLAELVSAGDAARRAAFATATAKTQSYLDAAWKAVVR